MSNYYTVDNDSDILSRHKTVDEAIATAKKLSLENPNKIFYVNHSYETANGVMYDTITDLMNGQYRSEA